MIQEKSINNLKQNKKNKILKIMMISYIENMVLD